MTVEMRRAPESQVEHLRQLLVVNERQAEQIRRLESQNATLRAANTRLKTSAEGRLFDD